MYKPGLTIWYRVKDLEVTKHFYEKVLNFEVMMYSAKDDMVIMKTPTPFTEIGFSTSNDVKPSNASVVFEVINIEESIDQLTQKGVNFTGEIEIMPGLVKLVSFTDPDGNSFMLAESLS